VLHPLSAGCRYQKEPSLSSCTGVNNLNNLVNQLVSGTFSCPEEFGEIADFIIEGVGLARAAPCEFAEPIDWLCRLSHQHRARVLSFYYANVRMNYGTATNDHYKSSSLKKHVDNIIAYMRHFEVQDNSGKMLELYTANYVWTTSSYYKKLHKVRKQVDKAEVDREDALTVERIDGASNGVGKGGGHAFEISPSQSHTFRIFLDNQLLRLERSDFAYIADDESDWLNVIAAGSKTGYAQYLCVVRSRWMLDVATNGLGRGVESFAKMADFDYKWVSSCVCSKPLTQSRRGSPRVPYQNVWPFWKSFLSIHQ
jgi:hypothetical protein